LRYNLVACRWSTSISKANCNFVFRCRRDERSDGAITSAVSDVNRANQNESKISHFCAGGELFRPDFADPEQFAAAQNAAILHPVFFVAKNGSSPSCVSFEKIAVLRPGQSRFQQSAIAKFHVPAALAIGYISSFQANNRISGRFSRILSQKGEGEI
jgi:hypothetical protein